MADLRNEVPVSKPPSSGLPSNMENPSNISNINPPDERTLQSENENQLTEQLLPPETEQPQPDMHVGADKENKQIHTNEATKASDNFIHGEKHGFLRTLGHVFRTASTEFFTWMGSSMIPVGISVAATFSFAKDRIRDAFSTAVSSMNKIPAFQLQEDLFRKIGGLLNNTVITHDGYQTMLKQGLEKVIDAGPFVGVGITAIGALSTLIGSAIGWQGAKHRKETSRLFKIGKITELAAATAGILNPAVGFLYPIAKGFSIGATYLSQTGRP